MSYLCVDGGQTRTAIFLLRGEGEQLAFWEERPFITPSLPGGMEIFRGIIRSVCETLQTQIDAHSYELPEAACFSLSGFKESDSELAQLVETEVRAHFPRITHVYTVPDYVGAWAAATRGAPGIIIISGGGSIAYGRDQQGRALRAGGWGHLLADEGSGYWIGMQAIKAVMRANDHIIPATRLQEPLQQRLQAGDNAELQQRVYSGAVDDAEIARLVPLVLQVAEEGDRAAQNILHEGAHYLAGLAAALIGSLGKLPVYPTGGVFQASLMRSLLEQQLSRLGLSVDVRAEHIDQLYGLLIIARQGLK
ncbi:hypothetical protein EPA93_18225 [Ktedonosporobacter rubrisoli]|uniref:ATPase BadF/BadG/BcrA/BcrD type domain-containing protein n=1 Tax=Ktedonosporobacter rubrisoli TaxID=2509675 RepID=A0A4P6JSI5_KTERU|nr:BadF/BadG/BcrA/BcrD ATPase family protein [Ktedonosporobacter rubrisoli]QBD77826.1 hypothetical protein EPA93_18225 [Ktedonosporobacter rubrisoli]